MPTLSDDDAARLRDLAHSGIQLLVRNSDGATSADGTAWVESSRKGDLRLTVYHCTVPRSPLLRYKAVCLVPYAPAVVCEFVSDSARRLTWDTNIARLDCTELGSDSRGRTLVLNSETKQVGPVSAREFIDAVAIVSLGGGRLANGGAGIAEPSPFPVRPGIVRGFNSPGGGWLFEPVLEGNQVHTRVSYVIHCDLKGWLPSMVVNAALTGSYVTFFADLARAMEAHGVDRGQGQEEAKAAMASSA